MKDITVNIALEIAAHEGLVRQMYLDGGGVPTWSIGVTSKSGHKVERYKNNPQTLQYCIDVYIWLLRTEYLPDVVDVFGDRLSEAQLAAALSFHWNTGKIKTASWCKKWLAGDIAGAKQGFLAYNKPASIKERRKREYELFFNGTWTNNGKCTEYTRVASSGGPDWGSAKSIDITQAVKIALDDDDAALPTTPKPEEVTAPVTFSTPNSFLSWFKGLFK